MKNIKKILRPYLSPVYNIAHNKLNINMLRLIMGETVRKVID